MENYAKKLISFEGWLRGKEYFRALRALKIAKEQHSGQRKDGSPEFVHPLYVALFVRTLHSNLLYPEDTIAAAFLHDTFEDHRVPPDEIEKQCGIRVRTSVMLLSKFTKESAKKSDADYFSAMTQDPIASIVKGADRIHNVQTMYLPFSLEKQKAYILETEQFILIMLKIARSLFPEQELAYFNIQYLLKSQIELVKLIHLQMDNQKATDGVEALNKDFETINLMLERA